MNHYIVEHIKKTVSNHFATFLASLFSMSIVLSCLSLILLARQNLVAMSDRWSQDNEMTAYLDEDLTDTSEALLKAKIENLPEVERVTYVSKTESARRFLKRLGHLSPDFVQSENAEDNPLPATFDISLKAGMDLGERSKIVEAVAQSVSKLAGVTEVSYGHGWLSGWSKFIEKFNVATMASIALVLLIGLLIVGNATRVSMERRVEEVEVLELVGATSSWIRRPFLVEGAFLGVLSAALSLVFSNFLNQMVFNYFSEVGILWVSESKLNLSWNSALLILFIGFLFGLVGSYLCVRKINTGWRTGEAHVSE